MAKKKKKEGGPEIPEWVVTFGDMMSLLLCFFILLQMFSELKKDHEYQRVVSAVKEAFGYKGGVGVTPTDDLPMKSIIEMLETLTIKAFKEQKVSKASDPGMDGPETRVTNIRDGVVFTLGGPATFDEGSAELKPRVREELEKLAVMLRGRNNKVVIRGHAAAKHLGPSSPWQDLDELAFARARNVKDALIALGISDRVFRIEAVGVREPVRPRAVDPFEVAENRRVEVIMTEQIVEELSDGAALPLPEMPDDGGT